jgi:hypothetical protein
LYQPWNRLTDPAVPPVEPLSQELKMLVGCDGLGSGDTRYGQKVLD